MRTPNDICLLCDTDNATKENSHIIPKFMGKTLLSDRGANRGYILDTNNGHLPADIVQDIAKENYLFCPNCESYFSFIETYMAERLHKRLWTAKLIDQFPLHENIGGVNWKVCEQVNSSIFRLFIYSIMWRCSISQNRLHAAFKLSDDEDALLKKDLQKFISSSYREFISKVEEHYKTISIYPFVIYTAKSFPNKTNNTIYTSSHNRNPFVLHLNEYILIFSFVSNDTFDRFEILINNDRSPIKIGFFSEEFWVSENKRFMTNTVEMTYKKANESGKKVYLDRKIKRDK